MRLFQAVLMRKFGKGIVMIASRDFKSAELLLQSLCTVNETYLIIGEFEAFTNNSFIWSTSIIPE